MRRIPKMLVGAAIVLLASAGLAACGSTSDDAQRAAAAAITHTQVSATTKSSPATSVTCADPTASLRPPATLPVPGSMPAGSFMARIRRRGRLIAGVDQNTLLLAYLNPLTGQLEGAEIDLVREIARAIFGDPNAVEFRAITTDERIPAVEDGNVDIVVDAMTITCARREHVDFSTVYYDAGQRVLVPSSSTARSIHDLAGKRVCATKGSTTIENLAHYPVRPVGVEQRTDCLVDLQEGLVDAVSSDDTILLGFQHQDPYTKVIGRRLSDEPYGVAIARSHPTFVRFVNGVLARLRSEGRLSAIFHHWLGSAASPPPQPRYEG
jgi:polar amino acid transport system substrate-binding protein